MSKFELIECIREINRSASSEFLEMFSEEQLGEYLDHLMELNLEEVMICA